MAMSFLALLSLAIAGAGLYHHFNRRMNWTLIPSLEIGAGFFVAAVMASAALSTAVLSVSHASYLVITISVLLSGVLLFSRAALHYPGSMRFWKTTGTSIPGGVALTIMAAYLLLILLNNLYRDIFPWDAFTTWMYRAKVWVLTNEAVGFFSLSEWLASEASGYTLSASHYPISVSAIAAFSASVSGGWSDQAASLPWFFASVASMLLMAGLCQLQHPGNQLVSLICGALLITTPLMHLHGVLAGYADLWVMGTSGMGLAGLCIWNQQRSTKVLFLSVTLLALGCFWKAEGWLWLTIGTLTIAAQGLWQAFGWRAVLAGCVLVALGWVIQPLNLGVLGTWGVDSEGFRLGALGTIGIRPYNPFDDYLHMTLWQGNFLLIAPLYLIAIARMLFGDPRRFSGYLLMGVGIAASHGVIFGLSAYSEYAQIGTAINRLLLQTLPVFIVTITAAWRLDALSNPAHTTDSGRGSRPQLSAALLAAVGIAIFALPCLLLLYGHSADDERGENVTASSFAYTASELEPVVGRLVEGPQGYQFEGDQAPIGVAAAPMTSPGTAQPRYLITQSWMTEPEAISFYWINTDTPQVHSTPVMLSGDSVIDMAGFPDFWQKPIREMGYLVQPAAFHTTALKSFSLSDSLFDAPYALINHWTTPAPLSQKLINMTAGHSEAPITLQGWLTLTLLGLCMVSLMGAARLRGPQSSATQVLILGAGILWAVGSLGHINQVLAITTPTIDEANPSVERPLPGGPQLREVSDFLASSETTAGQPIFAVGIDDQGRFDAERLPFMVAPVAASAISAPQLQQIGPQLDGALVIFGQDARQLNDIATALINIDAGRLLSQGEGYVTLWVGGK